ncbi:MAG: SDR family oxidoreductase [Deltaproteobacteria bacterium]|nr:SDR family oxidoreductase [Deltaproteobacteria bacterium]
MARLTGKVAIITGGAGGIGIAAGRQFAAEGAKVLLVDLAEEPLKQAANTIGSNAVSYAVADVSQPEPTQHYVRTAVERYGGIDIYVANAGIEGAVQPITDYPLELFDRVLAVNVRGVWLGLKCVIPEMKKRGGGSIVITSSVAGIKGTPGVSAYVTSKHAVIGMMRTAALECAPFNIRVNTVNPSPIDTRMMRSLEEGFAPGAGEQAKKNLSNWIPLKRYGTSEEVASVMLFLASDDSRYCSGGVYMVDGGVSAM